MQPVATPSPSENLPNDPGFYVFRSSRTEWLADLLALNLRRHLSANPFAPMVVCVGSRGMERWLRQRLGGSTLGVAANMQFPFPAEALSAAFEGNPHREEAWGAEALPWAVARVLPGLLSAPEFAEVGGWLNRTGGEAPAACDRDRLALAAEMASLLDRAALFRPAWVDAWEAGRFPDGPPQWLGALWRAMRGLIPGVQPAEWLRRARPVPGEMVHIFCVSSTPPAWLDGWKRVSAIRPVCLYALAPSEHYWGDLQTREEQRREERIVRGLAHAPVDQNALLANLGRLCRDATDLVLEAGGESVELEGAFVDPGEATLLAAVQSDMLHVRASAEVAERHPFRQLQSTDRSVGVHACHGPTRQVEALREALLDLFERDPTLEPRHVVVMTPDVTAFGPLIQAVFGEGKPQFETGKGWGAIGGPAIPAVIHDLGVRAVNPMADALLRVIALVQGRLTATAFVEFCSIEPVQTRFSIHESELAALRGWLSGAGARWGADGAERAAISQLDQNEYTFAFAFDRLALGTVMGSESSAEGGLWRGRAPFDEIVGEQAGFGKIAELAARIERWRKRLCGPNRVAEWVDLLLSAMDELTEAGRETGFLRSEVAGVLESLRRQAEQFNEPVTLDAIASVLTARFEGSMGGDRPATGGVTVCALAPMRSVPFRVVCLLGMDDGAFPRKPTRREFDAVAGKPQRGDRDPREEDRNLLLEAVLCCRDHLLVFYTGRDATTGKELPPAVPVAELFEAINSTFPVPEGHAGQALSLVTTHHAVQPFLPSGFRDSPAWPGQPAPRRFDGRMFEAARQLSEVRGGGVAPLDLSVDFPDPERPTSVTVAELYEWTRRPVRTLVKSRVGVNLGDFSEELVDREPLALDSLAGWSLGTDLASRFLAGQRDSRAVAADLLARGVVPPGSPGRHLVAEKWAAIEAAGHLLPASPEVRIWPVRLPLGGVELVGTLATVGGEIVDFAPDAPGKSRRLWAVWLRLLVASALGLPAVRGQVIGVERGKGVSIVLNGPADALVHLCDLVELWKLARTRALPLLEKSSFAYASALPLDATPSADDVAAACAAAQGAWNGGYDSPGEREDRTLSLVFGGNAPFRDGPGVSAAFHDLARRVWFPLRRCVEATE